MSDEASWNNRHVLPARPIRWLLFGTTFKQKSKMSSISSSEKDEITARPPSKVSKKDYKQCYMHLTSIKKEETKHFTRTCWDTFRNSVKRWLGLQGENQRISETYKHCLDIEFDNVPKDAGFHSTCYRRFIDKKRLDAAEKRVTQCPEAQVQDQGQSVSSGSSTSIECPTKKLRSRTGLPAACAGPVLPALCIICKNYLQVHYCCRQTPEGTPFRGRNVVSRPVAESC